MNHVVQESPATSMVKDSFQTGLLKDNKLIRVVWGCG
jgi:hypothetical protein